MTIASGQELKVKIEIYDIYDQIIKTDSETIVRLYMKMELANGFLEYKPIIQN